MTNHSAPLAGHPRRQEIEDAIRARHSNGDIAARYGVGSQDGLPPEEVVRQHRLAIVEPPTLAVDHALALAERPAVVFTPEESLDPAQPFLYVYVGPARRIGPSGRHVGPGDLVTAAEAGNGVSHGTVVRLPGFRGIGALLRAAVARADALNALVASGDAALLAAERAELLALKVNESEPE